MEMTAYAVTINAVIVQRDCSLMVYSVRGIAEAEARQIVGAEVVEVTLASKETNTADT